MLTESNELCIPHIKPFQAPVNADNADGLTVSGNVFRDCEDYQIGSHSKNAVVSSNQFLPKGDCNADGSLNIADVILLQKYVILLIFTNN